jgi:DNA-binding XRE family transcriptional regulator
MSPDEYKAHREKLGLTQAGLAALLGVPRESISRREHGIQSITAEMVLALDALRTYRKIDWSQPTVKIAKILGVDPSSVSSARRRHAPETVGVVGKQKIQWDSVDWTMRNCDIAKALGSNPAWVSTVRKKLGKRHIGSNTAGQTAAPKTSEPNP